MQVQGRLKHYTLIFATGVGLFLNPAIAQAESNAQPRSLQQQVQDVADYLIGVLDTASQAAQQPNRSAVQMTTCAVQLRTPLPSEPEGTIYLYQEQALSDRLDQPYRQRFLQLSPSPLSQSVRSLAFRPAEPEQWIGVCDQPADAQVVNAADLGEPVCSVFLRPWRAGYLGRTPIDGCPTQFRGAVRITNQIWLHESGMETWDRGFDQSGAQLWGAEDEAYQFRRRPAQSGEASQNSSGKTH